MEARDVPFSEEIQVQPCAGSIMACVFWGRQGMLLVEVEPPEITVNTNYYSSLFSDQLHPVIRRKCPGRLQQGVIFHRDNAPLIKLIKLHRKLPRWVGRSDTSAIQPRSGTKWFLLWMTHWVELYLTTMTQCSSMSWNLYVVLTKISELEASHDL